MTPAPFPAVGRIAGIDFGTVRIGVALSDPGQHLASPWDTYNRQGADQDARYFQQLVREERVVGFVVGVPVHMSGDESSKSREARQFGVWLARITGLPVCYQDERLSTAEANRFLAESGMSRRKVKLRRDRVAAQVILSSYLEASRPKPPEPLED